MPVDSPLKCLVIGTPSGVRVEGFQAALRKFGHPEAEVVDYKAWNKISIEQRADYIRVADRVRVESPGRPPRKAAANAFVAKRRYWQKLLLNKESEKTRCFWIANRTDFKAEDFEGLDEFTDQFINPTIYLNHPQGIDLACDKIRTIEALAEHGVPVPEQLAYIDGTDDGYNQVREAMSRTGVNRVFIKVRFGYSGSGIVAYQAIGNRELATTTVGLMQEEKFDPILFNTRRIKRYVEPETIQVLLNTLCSIGVYVERWIPKAGVYNRASDLRVVTIAGKARQIVLRMSKSPITNLHLLNERSGPDPLKQKMRPSDWDALIATCEQVARCFPNMLYLGIDVAVHADLRKHTVLEVNAWGDLLKGITDRGQTTYEAEVQAMANWSGSLD